MRPAVMAHVVSGHKRDGGSTGSSADCDSLPGEGGELEGCPGAPEHPPLHLDGKTLGHPTAAPGE